MGMRIAVESARTQRNAKTRETDFLIEQKNNNMKQKTALQEILDTLENDWLSPQPYIDLVRSKLELEREQIKDAFVSGSLRGKGEIPFNCEQFYSQTYETNPTQE